MTNKEKNNLNIMMKPIKKKNDNIYKSEAQEIRQINEN